MSAGMRALPLALPLAGLFLTQAQLDSQTISARAVIAAPKNSVRLGGVTDRVDGLWAGLAFDLHIGRFAVSGHGTRGQLTPAEAGTAPDRDVGEVSLGGRYDVRPWLGFELRYTARAFSSAAGRQRWDMLGVGASATHDLGTPEVSAFAGLAYLPLVKVSGEEGPSSALGSEVGISVAPSQIPLVFLLGYQVQRFRFPATTGRSEQFEALTLSVGVRARRLGGRWTLRGRRRERRSVRIGRDVQEQRDLRLPNLLARRSRTSGHRAIPHLEPLSRRLYEDVSHPQTRAAGVHGRFRRVWAGFARASVRRQLGDRRASV